MKSTDIREMNPSAISENLANAKASDQKVEAKVRVLIANEHHNAFPSIAKWGGKFWIGYREGEDHGGQGHIVILSSDDGNEWSEVHRVQQGWACRDPQLVSTDGRLWMYFVEVTHPDEGRNHLSHAISTTDGSTWQTHGQVYNDHAIFWRPIHHDGTFYCMSYETHPSRKLELIKSTDGLDWQLVSELSNGDRPWSETCCYIDEDQTMTAFLRFKYSVQRPENPCLAEVWQSKPPYTEWTTKCQLPIRIGGPGVETFNGKTYLFTRGHNQVGSCNAMNIYQWTGEQLVPYSSIPCMRDAAYGQAVQNGDAMLMVFYCTAPDGVNLYLADVPLV